MEHLLPFEMLRLARYPLLSGLIFESSLALIHFFRDPFTHLPLYPSTKKTITEESELQNSNGTCHVVNCRTAVVKRSCPAYSSCPSWTLPHGGRSLPAWSDIYQDINIPHSAAAHGEETASMSLSQPTRRICRNTEKTTSRAMSAGTQPLLSARRGA